MKFNVNSPILFVMVGILILVVLAQSIFFLVRALRRAKEIGMEKTVIKKTISSSAVFTIAPAIAIPVSYTHLRAALCIPGLCLSVPGQVFQRHDN